MDIGQQTLAERLTLELARANLRNPESAFLMPA
jgi:hypothetical protein